MKRKNKKVAPSLKADSKTDSSSSCPCGKTLKGRPAWIACDLCKQWWHGSCVSLTTEICTIFRKKNLPYLCPVCTLSKVDHKDKANKSDKPVLSEDSLISNSTDSDSEQDNSGTGRVELESNSNSGNNLKRVLIVDGLKNPGEYQNSRTIKEEIRKYKGDIRIKYAYPLNRGGLAIHTESEADIDLLKTNWPEEAFKGSSSLSFHENDVKPRCIFKNVSPHLIDEYIVSEIEKQLKISINIRRLKYRDTGRPMPVVLVTCSSFEDLQIIFKSEVTLGNKTIKVDSYKSKRNTPVRCYNCQEFGHVAAICKNLHKCENCAEDHLGLCSSVSKCANCGNSHPSSSASCPVFLAIKEKLSRRY